jgi:hypothetical protein
MFELDTGLLCRKAPVDLDRLLIACGLPGHHLPFSLGLGANAALQGMSREDREFNLCHI